MCYQYSIHKLHYQLIEIMIDVLYDLLTSLARSIGQVVQG